MSVLPAWMRAIPLMMGLCCALPACMQATPDVASGDPARLKSQSQSVAPATSTINDPDGGPDQQATELPPDAWHGNWRLVAADDPHDQALMALSIQSSVGEATGSGDYALHQPFCDAVANVAISGGADCELAGLGGTFDQVDASPSRLVLTFHPTADGMAHRLELRHEGERLVGDYAFDANDIHRPVIAERSPVQ